MFSEIRKLACFIVGSVIFFSVSNSWAEQPKTRIDLLLAKQDARFAAEDLKNMIKAQEEIVALKPELRDSAIMLAAGLLSTKLNEWGQKEIDAGKKTQKQMMYVVGLSMMGLARLTQAVNLNEASACHTKEAFNLIAMSQGKPREYANCRKSAYSTEMQVNVMKEAYRPEMKDIEELVNRWATNVALFSNGVAKLDGYGVR
jgi:hypothetical protein